MIEWIYYPRSDKPTEMVLKIVNIFQDAYEQINSKSHRKISNEVLSEISDSLILEGFEVERGKKKHQKIYVPVLFGMNGEPEKAFEADAYNSEESFVIEVEAGRGYTNYQFLKDLFQACMMHNVFYLAIAIRKIYRSSKDFNKVVRFFDTLYVSNRLKLPLKGILLIGY